MNQKKSLQLKNVKKTAEAISLERLHKWLMANCHQTWYLGNYPTTCEHEWALGPIKYIHPVFDTRTMTIFRLETRGFIDIVVDFREEFDGDLLDLLDHKLKLREERLKLERGEKNA